ncbi:MAG: helix-turn-helix transcriptional regulator [bacterium]
MGTIYRNDVIVENFFFYLNNSDFSQKQYEEEQGLPKGTLSKWKNKTVNITVEQLHNAACFFGITINDLIYDKAEKDNILTLTDDKSTAYLIHKVEKVKFFTHSIKNWWKNIIYIICIFIILLIFFVSIGEYAVSFAFPFFISQFFLKKPYINSKNISYTINHLDKINFQIDEEEDKHYIFKICSKITNILLLVTIGVLLFNVLIDLYGQFSNAVEVDSNLLMLVIITLLVCTHLVFLKIDSPILKHYDKIYNEKTDKYTQKLCTLIGNIFLILLTVFISFYIFNLHLVAIALIIFIFDAIDFYVTKQKMLEYKVVYHAYGAKGVNLFPWD